MHVDSSFSLKLTKSIVSVEILTLLLEFSSGESYKKKLFIFILQVSFFLLIPPFETSENTFITDFCRLIFARLSLMSLYY